MLSLSTKERKAMFNKPSNYSIPLWSWIDTESTDTFFSDLENKYKLLGTKSKQIPKMSLSLELSKKLKVDKLRNTMITELEDELKDLKNILNKIKELELLREQEINEIKNEAKRKLNMLDNDINDTLEKVDVNVTTLKVRCRFCEKLHNFEEERELKLSAKEKRKERKRLKEEVKNNKDDVLDLLLVCKTKISKLLTDLEYEKHNALHDITILESRLIKLGINTNW